MMERKEKKRPTEKRKSERKVNERQSEDDDDVTSFPFIFDAIFILTSHVKFT